jgi:alpha-mannosidase
MKNKRKIHLICNAHLDPVWLWEWEEGAAVTLSTFRTAAELCEQNDCFIFNHNEVILYKWVQEYEPELFQRIQKLVENGNWHIMGGWYLQPDCNMPCGESFVRQILIGKNYFKKHFGVDVSTAINFDPFGHTRGLVQILAKSGYDSYLFGRPDPNSLPSLPNEFVWIGYDGSEVMATRFDGWYNSRLGQAQQKIEKWIKDHPDKELSIILWGVGNHGGGPSRKDVSDLNDFISQATDYDIAHSTPENYFKHLSQYKSSLPQHKKDLNPWAIGCYTSQIRIKQKQRLLENEIYSLEKMASAAVVQGVMEYPYEQIHEALCDLMTGQFHDILPGSSIQPVEEASLRMLDHGLEIISRLKTRTFFALACGQPYAKKNRIPILVYNPHPFKVNTIVECEFNLPDFDDSGKFNQVLVYDKNKLLNSQVEQELSNLKIDWRKRVVFAAELEPSQMNRFDCKLKIIDKKPDPILKVQDDKITFKTKFMTVIINTTTGLIDSYQINDKNCVGACAFEPIVMEDDDDSWGMFGKSFSKVVGRFKLMDKHSGSEFSGLTGSEIDSVRIIEDGPVRSVVEAVFAYGKSFICQRYKLPKDGTEIEVEIEVFWNEKTKMLKLSIPTIGCDNKYFGQVAYGVHELPNNGDEAVAHKWTAVVSQERDFVLTCINDGIYGSDFSKDGLRLTLLRSPAYSAHPDENNIVHIPPDRFTPRIDQGQRFFRFWFNGGRISERLEKIDREALVKNEKPFALSFFPSGQGEQLQPLAVLSDNVVQIAAIKKAENNGNLIVRLFEPTGKKRTTMLTIPVINKNLSINLEGFEIKTLSIDVNTGNINEVNLLENC